MRRSPALSVAERGDEIGSQRGEIGRSIAGQNAPGLDAREVEQRVNEAQQSQRVPMRDVESLALVFRQRSGFSERILQWAEHEG
jgi:hypothetical protein